MGAAVIFVIVLASIVTNLIYTFVLVPTGLTYLQDVYKRQGLGIYIAFQPGAISGYRYIFRIDPAAFFNPQVIIYAMGQAFFSLSLIHIFP